MHSAERVIFDLGRVTPMPEESILFVVDNSFADQVFIAIGQRHLELINRRTVAFFCGKQIGLFRSLLKLAITPPLQVSK